MFQNHLAASARDSFEDLCQTQNKEMQKSRSNEKTDILKFEHYVFKNFSKAEDDFAKNISKNENDLFTNIFETIFMSRSTENRPKEKDEYSESEEKIVEIIDGNKNKVKGEETFFIFSDKIIFIHVFRYCKHVNCSVISIGN